eukprot:CAMPEP_0183500354 /NCGR_PEP_ID=MMETSP0371-20130417/2406_1 /TAXON_ID=268820 /ORGANISM="Peridinium aciculiferum, Strain PAER-2" /LENGTH=66 /DNA_ID=CAMNT_0025694407 /DNA_START=57 /DNA_END=254 /DNA_ORIENTATION=+
MARLHSALVPAALLAAALLYLGQQAFVAPRAPGLRTSDVRQLVSLRANANSVSTGLTWPSPEAEAK